jgi:hypothetical protein
MPKTSNAEHKRGAAMATRARIAREVERLERELFRGLPHMFEDEVNVRKKELEALRKTLARADRQVSGARKHKPIDQQTELFK